MGKVLKRPWVRLRRVFPPLGVELALRNLRGCDFEASFRTVSDPENKARQSKVKRAVSAAPKGDSAGVPCPAAFWCPPSSPCGEEGGPLR